MMFPFGRRALTAALAVIMSSALVGAQQLNSKKDSRSQSDSRQSEPRQSDSRQSDLRQSDPRQSSPGKPWWKDDQFKKSVDAIMSKLSTTRS